MTSTPGLLIGAPASRNGKTTVTLGVLRALRDAGFRPASIKVGPDYIDPAFHTAASGRPCLNLDLWAMRNECVSSVVSQAGSGARLIVGEGVMGIFDGADDGSGSTAAVAHHTGWPIVLVVDASAMAASAAAVVHGFTTFREGVSIAGVIFNRVGSTAHGRLLERAMGAAGPPVLGSLPHDPGLELPDRHLGLVQAREHPALEPFIERAATRVRENISLDQLVELARPFRDSVPPTGHPLPPIGQDIAVAQDDAFHFAYDLTLSGWKRAGAALRFFSPLADEGPPESCDAVYLPGGYPELGAARLASNRGFRAGMRRAAKRGATVYGECGGYMALGTGLVGTDGARHAMLGLLPLETSFEDPTLTIGYREVTLADNGPLGSAAARFRGHEFHYASAITHREGPALFHGRNSGGRELGPIGLRVGNVAGSFVHLMDARADLDGR